MGPLQGGFPVVDHHAVTCGDFCGGPVAEGRSAGATEGWGQRYLGDKGSGEDGGGALMLGMKVRGSDE